jgi:hypothetical protein
MWPRRALRRRQALARGVMIITSAIRGRPPVMHQGALVVAAAGVAIMAVTPGTAPAETGTAEAMEVAMEMAVVATTDPCRPASRNASPARALPAGSGC